MSDAGDPGLYAIRRLSFAVPVIVDATFFHESHRSQEHFWTLLGNNGMIW